MAAPDPTPSSRYAQNVGDFRVDGECCLDCGVPSHNAPGLFASEDGMCRLTREPRLPEDFAAMA